MSAFVDTVIRAFDRYLPEPFTFGLLMTLIAMLLTLGTTPSGPVEVLVAWGDGLSSLLPFITQVCLTILFAYTLAHLGPVARPLARLASLPSSARGAYVFCTFFTGIVCLIAWPLGTILGGLMARQVALSCNDRGITVHYPLLAGAAFSGFVVWHMGYTGSAPLLVATEGHPMMALTGGIIDVSRTIFTPLNLLTIVVTLALVALAATRLEPVEPEPANSETAGAGAELDSIVHGETARAGLAGALENARWPTLVTGLCLVAYVGWWFATRGLDLNLNIVNWTFLAACLLLCRSAKDLADVMMAGGRAIVPTLIQYPIYAGVMGIMLNTGFIAQVAGVFATIGSAQTLPLIAFLSGGVINLFIPSGGAQWAVQGPAFLEAAKQLGTAPELIVMGVAYGDQWTNLIHPFVVIPLLIMTGLRANQVLSYSFVLFLVAGVPLAASLLIAGFMQ